MKKINISTKKYPNIFVMVDNEDFEYLNQFKWHYSNCGYARRTLNGKSLLIHQLLIDIPKGFLTDHINRNKLDNRRSNLRIADKRLNSINRGLQVNNTSGYKGVSWSKFHKKWKAYIWSNRKFIYLGLFDDIRRTIKVRIQAERIYHVI